LFVPNGSFKQALAPIGSPHRARHRPDPAVQLELISRS
jgi:hypothetical protein